MDAVNYGIGHIYYLTKKGANFIVKEIETNLEQVHYCSVTPNISPQTLFHRTQAIDCQIELELSCSKHDTQIIFYDRDIDSLGKVNEQIIWTEKLDLVLVLLDT